MTDDRKILRPPMDITTLSTVDEGRRLEVSATIESVCWTALTILADEDESLWVELDVGLHRVQLPLEAVRVALGRADEVHSETWFEKNVYSKE